MFHIVLAAGLLVIRHLFGFSGDSLTSGAVSGGANRGSSDAIETILRALIHSAILMVMVMARLSRLQTAYC